MADLTVYNPNTAGGVQVTPVAAGAAGDRFQAGFGQKYKLRIVNASGASRTVTVDDPDATNPGEYKTLNRDVDIVLATNQTRDKLIDATRFRDANGWVNLSYSSNVGLTVDVSGPYS